MTFTTREVLERIAEILEGENGVRASLEELRKEYELVQEHSWPAEVKVLKAAAEHAEKAWGSQYPAMILFCEKIRSRPTERLRRFSGEVEVGLEVRVSQDRLEGITDRLHYYSDAVRDALERSSGCIGPGLYLSAEMAVQIDGVKKGGSHFLQTSHVTCTVIVNRE
ncbi:MAG: hypothetical protein ACOYX1_05270 [Acidobacteriota bacterium]